MDWNAHFIWTQFFLCAAAIVLAGTKLTRYGDRIAEATGLGRLWVGAVLLSIVTSLPEMVTACSSAWLGEPDIALQNMIGSNLFNILVLVMLDFLLRHRAVLAEADPGHRGSAWTGTAMMMVVAAAALTFNLGQDRGFAFKPYDRLLIGADSAVLIVIYGWAMWRIFKVGRDQRDSRSAAESAEARDKGMNLTRIWLVFGVSATLIVIFGYRMTQLGDIISETPLTIAGHQFMISDNFVGMFLIAIATSLPELVVTISAARLGAADMAVGNILGSNIFNMAIIALADFFYFHGPMVLFSGRAVIYTALLGALLTGIALHGLGRPVRRLAFSRLGPHSIAILVLYVSGMVFLASRGLLVS